MISREEQAKRIDQCMFDFSMILPVYDEEQIRLVRMTLKQDLAKLIPAWFSDLTKFCILNQKEYIEYLEYMESSIAYILGKTDTYIQPDYQDCNLVNDLKKEIKITKMIEEKKQKKREKKK